MKFNLILTQHHTSLFSENDASLFSESATSLFSENTAYLFSGNNNMYLPGVYSRNILLANGVSDYEEPVVLPDPFKSMETRKDYSKARYSVVKRSFLRVYPNPTKHYFIAEYHLEKEYNDMYLEILDVTANMVGEVNIEGKQNQAVIPVKDLKPGIYFIRLIAGGVVMDTQKITVL